VKNNLSRFILVLSDILAIFMGISIAYVIKSYFFIEHGRYVEYIDKLLIYLIVVIVLFNEGIYTKRYDFWHESRQVIKSLALSFLLVMSYLAITKNVEQFSNLVIIFAFMLMTLFIPLVKIILKTSLFKFGLWQREARVYATDDFIKDEIFNNPYLGYVHSLEKEAETIFINSTDLDQKELKRLISEQMRKRNEVIFIPIVNEYNMIHSDIYELSNTRTNLVVFKNRLRSKSRLLLQQLFNYFLALLLLPILLPVIGILAFLIKRESAGPVFFAHNRIGKDGKIVPTLKFRSMYVDAKERLEKLLEDNKIRKEWETNFKLKEDPRVTKIGAILRKTSLDELPQIFNVLKGEMNFVGPRPVIQKELDQYYDKDALYYLMVKPGITGLWQVSGRSDTDYDFRVSTDKWYVRNWSLWLDIVILFKTVKVVLFREGAY